jgi:hypothetical protein
MSPVITRNFAAIAETNGKIVWLIKFVLMRSVIRAIFSHRSSLSRGQGSIQFGNCRETHAKIFSFGAIVLMHSVIRAKFGDQSSSSPGQGSIQFGNCRKTHAKIFSFRDDQQKKDDRSSSKSLSLERNKFSS